MAGSGFTRRFSSDPGRTVISAIEGVVIIDGAPPINVLGVNTGVVALLGEFPDVTNAIAVDASGNITTQYRPTEVFGRSDTETQFGGWDETIGDFGVSQGNGYVELANKRCPRLMIVAMNLASSKGVRVWRKLPTNKSATDASPAQPVQGAVVPAAREFKNGTDRVRVAKRIVFSQTPAFYQATDGAVTSAAPAAARPFTGSGFDVALRPDGSRGVKKGDIIVIGVTSGAGALGANADTYRVNLVTSATVLQLEKMDGASFDWTTTTGLPYRVHTSDVADTGGVSNATEAAGYLVPARPLDNAVGTSITMSPTIVPAAIAADSSDPLSGLQMRTQSVTGLTYTAAIQGANAASSATIDAQYALMFDAMLGDDTPQRDANLVWAARKSNTIAAKAKQHVLQQKANGIGRCTAISPVLTTLAPNAAFADAAPGVGAQRQEELFYGFPGLQTFVPAAVGFAVKGADGLTHTDGNLDTTADGWIITSLSNLPPERSIGQSADPMKTSMAGVVALQRGLTASQFDIGTYELAKSRGVVMPRRNRSSGFIFQSDVTTDQTPGRTTIHRRRMSFEIQDSLAIALDPFIKELLTEKFKSDVISAHVDYFETLLNRSSPAAARIAGYEIDLSGNTPEMENANIFVVIHNVELLSIADNIVIKSNVGNGVLDITVT